MVLSRVPFALVPVLAAILLGLTLSPRSGPNPWASWEIAWLDQLQRLTIASKPAVAQPWLLVGVDEESLQWLNKPALLWLEDFSLLAEALLKGGAKAVAFDFIFPSPSQSLPPALQQELQRQRWRFLQTQTSGKVAIGNLPDSQDRRGVHNHPDLESCAEGFGNLCSLGLVADADGRFRRLVADQSLALWLADQVNPQASQTLSLEQGILRIRYRQVQRPWLSLKNLLIQAQAGQPLEVARGKICLVAPQAPSLNDFRPSVLDHFAPVRHQGGTLGLEHHLAGAETILQGDYLVPYPRWLGGTASGAASLLLLSLAATGAGLWLLPTFAILWLLVHWAAFAGAGHWLPFWGPLLGGSLGFLCGQQWHYWTVERRRKLTEELFARMVAPQVVAKVLSDPKLRQLGGEQRRVTVLYTDINDFTPVCERHSPAEVILLLNQYFAEMVQLIFASEGMLKQFVGDEIMVIYGAPIEQPDHAARAVDTALKMLQRLRELEALAQGQDGFFDIKVGINTGEVVVGQVGADKHMEYAAVGDDVNLGARIMATTKKLGVNLLVSEATKLEAEPWLPDVEWISHGIQEFKGKSARLEVFEARRRGQA